MIAIHRRSGVRHGVHDDRLATLCGRVLYRRRFRVLTAGHVDCERCRAILARSSGVPVGAAA